MNASELRMSVRINKFDNFSKESMDQNEIDLQKLIDLGYKLVSGYIREYVDSSTEPKKYWPDRPHTIDNQIFGWQIVAHESKASSFLNKLNKK